MVAGSDNMWSVNLLASACNRAGIPSNHRKWTRRRSYCLLSQTTGDGMSDRILTWVGAGVLTAGVCASSLAGAAIAAAEDDPGAPATSESPPSSNTKSRSSANNTASSPGPADDTSEAPAADDHGAEDAGSPVDGDDTTGSVDEFEVTSDEIETAGRTRESQHSRATVAEHADDTVDATDSSGTAGGAPEETTSVADAGATVVVTDASLPASPPAATSEQPDTVGSVSAGTVVAGDVRARDTAQLLPSAVSEERPPRPTLLNVVGSFAWGVFDLLTKLVDTPPAVPPGSSLTAGRSKLEIDCGDGYTADADWYFPTEAQPEKFIYFQHGFPARSGFYNLTLQQLAERNNAVVVAPSISSNIFACDACAASGEPMHAAVARLFEGDRAALLASARAAGFEGALPDEFVFSGQSAGASLAIAAAGFYFQSASDAQKGDMAGVLLYEVSAIGSAKHGNALTNGLRKLPASVPVLNIAAEPNVQNSQSGANAIFAEERPGQFNGVQLVGGAHSDAFQSSILLGIPQLIVNVFFGASTPENTEAVHVLTEGWLIDMYENRVYDPATRTGIYGIPGEPGQVLVDIPTDAGPAQGYVLPVVQPKQSVIDRITNWFFGLLNVNYYAPCAVNSTESANTRNGLTCVV
jgi:hypothetical protein